MKSTKTITSSLLLFLFVCSCKSFAQNIILAPTELGGEYPIERNDAAHPCITPEQYKDIEQLIAENIKLLKLDKLQQKTTSTLFSWPLQTANGLNDCSYYYIGNYVDQDTSTPGIKDYNCGSVTYDGHRGTDIVSAPYPFLKMDNNQLNVIAAAPGTIIQKSDGYFDKNCAMNTDTANYIIIQHADGSVALYWHMKKFSLTSKIVGQTVITGEFLGVVGSSGSSTGPHLHFEVWSGTTANTLKDPWTGTCNALNPSTWWAAQKPYTEPAIIKASVNSALAVFPACPATETPNEDSCYAPGASARFYIFIRNETPGDTVHERIVNPGGSTFTSWTHNSITSYLASYWIQTRTLPTTAGIYTFETIYNGITCSKTFKVNCGALDIPTMSDPSQIQVSPNPASNAINITVNGIENGAYKFTLKNIIGQVVAEDNITIENNAIQKTFLISTLPDGIYLLVIESGKTRVVKKFIKQN